MPNSVDSFFARYDETVSSVGLKLRQFLLANIKGVTEQVDGTANILAYSLGPGYKGTICTILPSKKGIKLGFYRGSELPDPSKILRGSGKVHKYVEIKSEADTRSGDLKKLLSAAVTACKERLD